MERPEATRWCCPPDDNCVGSRIGREAARCIVERAQGRMVPERLIDIGFSIVDRASL